VENHNVRIAKMESLRMDQVREQPLQEMVQKKIRQKRHLPLQALQMALLRQLNLLHL